MIPHPRIRIKLWLFTTFIFDIQGKHNRDILESEFIDDNDRIQHNSAALIQLKGKLHQSHVQ